MDDLQFRVAVFNGSGNIIATQDYMEFQYGKRDYRISLPLYGRAFVDILVDDLGTIQFDENGPQLRELLLANPQKSIMNLLGRIAEAVIVRECDNDPEINRLFLSRARRINTHRTNAVRFKAIGTGLLSTKRLYPRRYNPSDTQRDIVWIDENEKLALMRGSNNRAGIEAGLQIKASSNGMNYILDDLLSLRYEAPLVYFPIYNDFDQIADVLYRKTNGEINIGEDFIDVRALDTGAFEEVKSYLPLTEALINGDIDLDELVREAYGNTTLKNAVLAEALDNANTNKDILVCG